jgi:hypothetical protein
MLRGARIERAGLDVLAMPGRVHRNQRLNRLSVPSPLRCTASHSSKVSCSLSKSCHASLAGSNSGHITDDGAADLSSGERVTRDGARSRLRDTSATSGQRSKLPPLVHPSEDDEAPTSASGKRTCGAENIGSSIGFFQYNRPGKDIGRPNDRASGRHNITADVRLLKAVMAGS